MLLCVVLLSSCSGRGLENTYVHRYMGFRLWADAYYNGLLHYVVWTFPIIAVANILYLLHYRARKLILVSAF